jgi:hypothetical protein
MKSIERTPKSMKQSIFTILFCLIFLTITNSLFSQSLPDKCELNGNLFYTDCIKYIGDCQDNKANGWGELYLNNNKILTGLFIDNILQDFHMDAFWADNNKYIFGQNKGSRFHGPCVTIANDYVFLSNYDNGQPVGNSDYFNVPKPNFELNGVFCDAYGYNAKDRTNCNLIPNTNSIIYVSSRGGKFWLSIVDLSTNKITRNFGSYTTPIKVFPKFVGFTSDNKFVFFDIRINENEAPKFLKCNLINGIYEFKSVLPQEISNHKNFITKINSNSYKDLIFEARKEWETKDNFYILKDSSYMKFFNNKLYSENRDYGTGSSLVIYNNKHEFIKSLDLPNFNILDFAVDENTNRIALSYKGKDTTYLSYFDLKTFQFVSNVFKRTDNPFDYRVKFSKTGMYLLYNLKSGTAIYLGNKLYYGVEGEIYDLSNEDKVIITNSNNGYINAYDLEKKTMIWRYQIGDDYMNSKCFNIDNKMYIISGRPTSYSGNLVVENGIKINSFVMPNPLFSLKEFIKNPEEIAIIKNNQIIETKNKSIQKNTSKVSGSNDDVLATYLMLKFLFALFESTSHTTSSYSSSQSVNYNAWQCTRCGALSRSLQEPSGGDFGGTGGCTDNGNHYWSHANTNRGWQCSRCGATSHCDREPSGGDFGGTGGCSDNGNHYWKRF